MATPVFSQEQVAWLREHFKIANTPAEGASGPGTLNIQSLSTGSGTPPLNPPPSAGSAALQLPLFDPTDGQQDGLTLLASVASLSKSTPPGTKQPALSGSSNPIPPKPTEITQVSLHQAGPYNPAAFLSTTVTKKILDLQFVEMNEVTLDDLPPTSSGRTTMPPLPVTNISRWVERYAVMAALLCTRFPEKGPELFAYLQTIVAAERNYDTQQWVTYDRLFRRQALSRKDLDWSVIDSRLYQSAFTGRARRIERCQFCLQDDHPADICARNPRPQVVSWIPQGWYPPTPQTPSGNTTQKSQEVCRRYNREACRAGRSCRYKHVCSACRGDHTRKDCKAPDRSRSPIARNLPNPQAGPGFHY